jgi:hypothetical protein
MASSLPRALPVGCYVLALRADGTAARPIIAAGKILTRVPRYGTLPL